MNQDCISAGQPDGMLPFKILESSSPKIGARLGRLSIRGRDIINTPHYVTCTTRGVVPHLSHDIVRSRTNIKGVYIALEDFVDRSNKRTPPILAQPVQEGESRLRKYTALPDDQVTILGLRRTPPVVSPTANAQNSLSICTAVGFQQMTIGEYTETVQRLLPDVIVCPGDIPYGASEKPGWRRLEKMSSRTERWLSELVEFKSKAQKSGESFHSHIFASVLPLPRESQSLYVDLLADELQTDITGLAIYECDTLVDLPEALSAKARLSLTEPKNPHQLLREVAMGIDIATVPFIAAATDAGIALSFTFPNDNLNGHETGRTSLGIDLWMTDYASDLSPLIPRCECYTCTKHHRAYLHHLLSAKEMLAWVLIQLHNLHTMDRFYDSIRRSISQGRFNEDREAFGLQYELEMPKKTGSGPRVRGYQYKSEGPNEAKKNPRAYAALDDTKEKVAGAQLLNTNEDMKKLDKKGIALASTP